MTELLDAVASWHSLLIVLLVFGFAPGFVLRILVNIYPRQDPRRRELVAELYSLRRIERPLFVAEQVETVLFEGLPRRFAFVIRRLVHRRLDQDLLKQIQRKLIENIPLGATLHELQLEAARDLASQRILVITGPVGTGKSTLAAGLARGLVNDASKPIRLPMFIRLAQYRPADRPLKEFVQRELASAAGVSMSFASRLMNEPRLLLVLDGVDELPEEWRSQVVASIRSLEQDCAQFIVTSRLEEYDSDHWKHGLVFRPLEDIE